MSLPLGDSPTHRIQCGWLRRALPPRHAGAAFVRPHCRPHIIEVHSTAACAASAQSPSAALNGYDGTAFFHHVAYTASYTTVQLRCRQRRKLHPDDVSTRQDGYAGRKIPTDRARKSRNKISVACKVIIYVQYVILYYIVGPTCRGPNGHVRASIEI